MMTEKEYIKYLPGMYQADAQDFLGRFLNAFEAVLSGRDDMGAVETWAIEKILNEIQNYFDPFKSPVEFLPWLAGWVALILKEEKEWYGDEDVADKNTTKNQIVPLAEDRYDPADPTMHRNRYLLSKIMQLYLKRGTLEGLLEYLRIYVGKNVEIEINEFAEPFRVGVTSTVGKDTVVGEGRPYYFHVYMKLSVPNREILVKKTKALKEIIDQEKPAHTYYGLTITVPTMQIAVHSTVGADTLLGGMIT